jgi:hypothetical protein
MITFLHSLQIPVQSWFDDVNDVELLDIVPLLEQLADVENIYSVLRNSNEDVRRCSASPPPPPYYAKQEQEIPHRTAI